MSVWLRLAGLSGASSVGLAAYGAHGRNFDATLLRTYESGNRLHMIHSAMLAVCASPLLKRPHLSGGLFLAGTVGFAGSCYAAALTGDRANGRFAPYGGGLLILGWLSLVF